MNIDNLRGDIIWGSLLGGCILGLFFPQTRELFVGATKSAPYLMGFIKVGVFATMGELLAGRIVFGFWKKPIGIGWRFTIWGFFGVSFALVFPVFAAGVQAAMNQHLLPVFSEDFLAKLSLAFWTSAIMNLAFAPTFMAFHRITDTWIEAGNGCFSDMRRVPLSKIVGTIQWPGFVDFVICKTIPLFWIPAHTITFLLPPEFRVLAASLLSIALGTILAFAKKTSAKEISTSDENSRKN